MTKQVAKPQAGDQLVIGKYLSGFDRKGKPVFRNLRKAQKENTFVQAVYADSKVRSANGDVFNVKPVREREYNEHGDLVQTAIFETVA